MAYATRTMWSPSAKKQELSHPDGIQVTGRGVQEVAVHTESTNRFIMLPLAAFLTVLVLGALAREPSVLQRQLLPDPSNSSETRSFNVTKCPGAWFSWWTDRIQADKKGKAIIFIN